MLEPHSDEALMRAYQRGEVAAFEALVRRHRAPVYAFLARLLGNRARAEDALQETWLRVVRAAATWRPSAKLTTWLYFIARNVSIDLSKREALRASESLEGERPDGGSAADSLAVDGVSPEEAAHGAKVRPLLEDALGTLPSEQREVFLLRELHGMTFHEIAEITETPENTVKSRFRYAVGGLRKALRDLRDAGPEPLARAERSAGG